MKYSGTIIGDSSNNNYYITSAKYIDEGATGGYDRVFATTDYVLPLNVEYLEIWGAYAGIGNSQSNRIVGNGESNQLDGRGGDDTLTGGGARDVFMFGAGGGNDVVTDFKAGSAPDADAIRLTGLTQFTSLTSVQSAMTQVGKDVMLQLSAGDSVTIKNTVVADFTSSNFQLSLDMSSMHLSFSDEFNSLSLWNGVSGTWRTDFGYGGSSDTLVARTLGGNGEKQIYVDPLMKGKSNVALGLNPFDIDDGVLTITAENAPSAAKAALYGFDYTSGLLTTKNSFSQTYGYFEAKLQLPEGKGAWPAFWLVPADGSWPPEIDVMEAYGTDAVTETMHSNAGGRSMNFSRNFVDGATEGMHTYGVLWTKETIKWYIDGTEVKSAATPADMHKPFYMLVNLALTPSTTGVVDADLKVDYVRAYSLSELQGGNTTPVPVVTPPLPPVVTLPTPPAQVRTLTGTDQADRLVSTGENGVILKALNGNDYLEARGQSNKLIGGKGDDTYKVSDVSHVVVESANEGSDRVDSTVSFTLSENVEALYLGGNAAINGTGNALNNTLMGNAGANVLIGLDGNDVLNGKEGADRMEGGKGNDTYWVDNVGDVVIELAGEGSDRVDATVSFTLSKNVEMLYLGGSAAINGNGNALNNTLTGNAGANVLIGLDGHDVLNGKEGADRMVGGKGNDTYWVDNVGDVVVELTSEGSDRVDATVSFTLSQNVEMLYLNGTAAINGTGNALGNTIVGNTAANVITGMGGNDLLTGGAGADVFVFASNDGNDRVTDFNSSSDTIKFVGVDQSTVHMFQSGKDVVIGYGTAGDMITLTGVQVIDPLLTQHILFG